MHIKAISGAYGNWLVSIPLKLFHSGHHNALSTTSTMLKNNYNFKIPTVKLQLEPAGSIKSSTAWKLSGKP